ncbi:4-(cytidine 5'-diphospho)-2-C-methyl-D-erythritol kinase [Arthrobacter sp. 08Y14]|uniref:4-(cytidine 5'-diphospho)-2-C-methyl-D-erythritol kinase n=1 Tax=Arthrobacter sp. 08Y14 TaxID=2058885 RepID=UPI000CE44E6E|nr:4-(cytidine 5'-diphospho)-2-C-methyl-D-erythritol kinase [Arthrobacter sp. 08Y14]
MSAAKFSPAQPPTAAPASVCVRAPGKINVSLRVGPLRPDGYHSVASVYLAVSLFEEVRATVTEGPGITVTVDSDGALQVPVKDIPLGPDNLAVRAAQALAPFAENPTGVHLHITKRVPVAGGMGGGSADAAAALVACDALWNTHLSREELAGIAAGLGADVPFSLLGGTAVGLGVGDRLTPAISKTPLHWVLVASDFGLSTPGVYGALDSLREEEQLQAVEPEEVDPAILTAMRSGNAQDLASVMSNDLQAAALQLAPGLADVLSAGERLGALAGMVSGSGPTVAFLAQNAPAAAELAAALRAGGHRALAVEGPVSGARLASAVAG